MANRFFTNVLNLLGGQKARASDVEADFDAVSTGFDKVQAELDALVAVDGTKAPKDTPSFTGPAVFAGPVTVPTVTAAQPGQLAVNQDALLTTIAQLGSFTAPVYRRLLASGPVYRNERLGVACSGSAILAALPSAPGMGDTVYFLDEVGNWGSGSNKLSIDPGAGKTIMDLAAGEVLDCTDPNDGFGLSWNGSNWRII